MTNVTCGAEIGHAWTHGGWGFDIPDVKSASYDQIKIGLLVTVAQLLGRLVSVLECSNTAKIPAHLAAIRRVLEEPERRRKRAVKTIIALTTKRGTRRGDPTRRKLARR